MMYLMVYMRFLVIALDSVSIDRLAWLDVFFPYVVIDSIGKNDLLINSTYLVGNLRFMLRVWLGPLRSHDTIMDGGEWAQLFLVWLHCWCFPSCDIWFMHMYVHCDVAFYMITLDAMD